MVSNFILHIIEWNVLQKTTKTLPLLPSRQQKMKSSESEMISLWFYLGVSAFWENAVVLSNLCHVKTEDTYWAVWSGSCFREKAKKQNKEKQVKTKQCLGTGGLIGFLWERKLCYIVAEVLCYHSSACLSLSSFCVFHLRL